MDLGKSFGGLIPGAHGAVLATLLRTGEPLTGRQVHGLLSDDHSLWSVQEALKSLAALGLVQTRTVGRAGVHTINEDHGSVAPLRQLLDPIAMLKSAISEVVDSEVEVVLIFGSVARGEATTGSDIDLAVIASPSWDQRIDLQETVTSRLGNDCDVLVFSPDEFKERAHDGEPVVSEILRDGVALLGAKPRVRTGAA